MFVCYDKLDDLSSAAAQIAKSQVNAGQRRQLYYFRDQQGLEVDFIIPAPSPAPASTPALRGKGRPAGMWMLEAKAIRSPSPGMARPMQALAKAWPTGATAAPLAGSWLVHRAARVAVDSTALVPGVQAVSVAQLADVFAGKCATPSQALHIL